MAEQPTIRKTSETIKVTVPLTAVDHEEIHAKLIEHNTKRADLEGRIETYQGYIKAAKKEVDTINSHIYAQIQVLDKGEKTIEMECWKILDYGAGAVRFVSKDNGDLVRERLMDDDEKQMSIDFEEDDEMEEVVCVQETTSPDVHPDDVTQLEPQIPTDEEATLQPLSFEQRKETANA